MTEVNGINFRFPLIFWAWGARKEEGNKKRKEEGKMKRVGENHSKQSEIPC